MKGLQPAWTSALALAVAYVLLSRSQAYNVSVCALIPLSNYQELVLGLAQAISDVNYRNDDIIDKEISSGLTLSKLNFRLWDVGDAGGRADDRVVEALMDCFDGGGQLVIGPGTSDGALVALPLASAFGKPIMEYDSTAPNLGPIESFVPFIGRTSYSDEIRARALTAFVQQMGWEKIPMMYSSGIWSSSMREALQSAAGDYYASAIPLGTSEMALRKAVSAVRRLKPQAVMLLVCDAEDLLPRLAQQASADGLDLSSSVWIDACGVMETLLKGDVVTRNMLSPILDGMVSTRIATVNKADKLAAKIAANDSLLTKGLMRTLEHSSVELSLSGWNNGEASLQASSNERQWDRVARLYDAVWALSAAWERTALQYPQHSGRLFTKQLYANLANLSFEGASGPCSFEADGKRNATGSKVVILRHSHMTSQVFELGTWTSENGLRGSTMQKIVIAAGGSNNQTMEWTTKSSLLAAEIGGIAIAVATAAVSAAVFALYILRRSSRIAPRRERPATSTCRINCQLGPRQQLDNETPVFKILDFLERFQDSKLQPPGAKEAAELYSLVFNHMDNLNEPVYLNAKSLENNDLDNDVIKYLLDSVDKSKNDTSNMMPSNSRSASEVLHGESRWSLRSLQSIMESFPFNKQKEVPDFTIPSRHEERICWTQDAEVSLKQNVKDKHQQSFESDFLRQTGCEHQETGDRKDMHGQPVSRHSRSALSTDVGEAQGSEALRSPASIGSGRFHCDRLLSFTEILEQRLMLQRGGEDEMTMQTNQRSVAIEILLDRSQDMQSLQDSSKCAIEGIGRDFFFDFCTPQSVVYNAVSPLLLVAKQCTQALDIQVLAKDQKCTDKFFKFVQLIEHGYISTGYHCKLHAADVTSRFVAILHNSGIAMHDYYTRLAGLTAAMIHDYQHPQLTNQCLVVQEDDIAQAFNDQAVIENHSICSALKAMKDPELDFLSAIINNLQQGKKASDMVSVEISARQIRQEFRRVVIQTVLGTDMSRHFEIIGHFNAKIVSDADLMRLGSGYNRWLNMSESQRILTLQMAIKVADIGHCALPLHQHQIWLEWLQEEMFAQGDIELQATLEISALMDRSKPGVQAPGAQVGFFQVIVLPLLEAWVKVFPECKALQDMACANFRHWEAAYQRSSSYKTLE